MKPDTILGAFDFAVEDPAWVAQRDKVRTLLERVLATRLGRLVRFAGVQGSVEKAETVEAVCERVATGESEVFELAADPVALRLNLLLGLFPAALTLRVRCFDAELDARAATILDDVLEVASAVAGAGCTQGLRRGAIAPITREQATYEYPRPRPPRVHETIEPGTIVDVIEPSFEDPDDPEASETARAMAEADLPAPAVRQERAPFVVIRWAENLVDLAALDRGCAAHEEWLATVAPTEIDGDYDERGDEAEPMRGLEARAGVTQYDPRGKIAYVAVVILPDGEPEEHYWASALELVNKRATGDGAPVAKVRLIVPLRRLALAFAARARAHGIDAVLYPGEGGRWWNPDPPGHWAYPPRP